MKWKPDKTKHAIASFLIVVFGWTLTNSVLQGVMMSAAIGLLKEAYDEFLTKGKSYWDNEDLIADAIGIAAGVILINLALEIGVRIWIYS